MQCIDITKAADLTAYIANYCKTRRGPILYQKCILTPIRNYYTWQSEVEYRLVFVTVCISLVLNNFTKNRLIEKSSDLR